MAHSGGHLPFEADVTEILADPSVGANLLTIAVNNTLDAHTIPQGEWVWKEVRNRSFKDRYSRWNSF